MRLVLVGCAVGASLVVPVAGTSADGPAPKPGRRAGEQVRVERPHRASLHRPRLCVIENAARDRAMCIGSQPRTGEELVLFGMEGRGAVVATVTATGPTTTQQCHSENLWDTDFRVLREAPDATSRMFAFTGLGFEAFDATMLLQPSVSPPPLRDEEEVFLGIDAGSDGTVDHLLTVRPCDHSLPKGAKPGPNARCFGHWRSRAGGWTMIVEDVIYGCR